MKVTLLDYKGNRKQFEIPEKSELFAAAILIESGDEVLQVVTRDSKISAYDASESRIIDFDDGDYTVFSEYKGIDLFADARWLARRSSYEGLAIAEEEGGVE